MKYCFIIGFVLFFLGILFLNSAEIFAGFCFLASFILIPIAFIMLFINLIKSRKQIKDNIKNFINGINALKIQNAPVDVSNLRPFLCSVSNLRKKDGNVVRGDCTFALEDDLFVISQDAEKIENNIESIYYFDIWDYKDETYFKIVMRSHTEYVFKSIHFEADKIADVLKTKGVKIEDNRE